MAKLRTTKDLILLLLHAPGKTGKPNEPISGQTRLMKMLFLFDKEIRRHFNKDSFEATAFPVFEAYDYGPYSPKVYAELEWLVNMGFIVVDESPENDALAEERAEYDYWTATTKADNDLDPSRVGKTFTLSKRGERFIDRVLPSWQITDDQMSILCEFKTRCVEASLRSLLRYTYSRYPEMTTKSTIRKEVLGYG